MVSARSKGLSRVREVKKILKGLGHQVEGPGYAVAFYGGSMKPVHRDYFGIADLISYDGEEFVLHQVTDLHNKSVHVKAIQEKKMKAWLWCKLKGKRSFGVFIVTPKEVIEFETKGDK